MDAPNQESEQTASQDARYANYCQVGYNAFEFLLEFGQMYEGEEASVHTRLVASPYYAKAFLAVFQAAVEAYERESSSAE